MPAHHALLPTEQHQYDHLPKLSQQVLHDRREFVFLILAGMFLGTLAMLNILGITRFIDMSFTIPLLGWHVPFAVAVGVLPYPITFLCTDFISELFGRKRANQVVWTGFILNLWVMLILWLGAALPPALPIDPATGEILTDAAGRLPLYFEIKSLAFAAVTASMFAYLIAQLVDVHIFHFLKRRTKGRHLWLRNNGSTLISQLVDTIAVILVTHSVGALPMNSDSPVAAQLLAYIGAGYVFKVAAALLDTIPFYFGAHKLSGFLRLPPPAHQPTPSAPAAVQAGVG